MWWTLAAATVASITALIIALLVYPRQKEIDRQFDLRRERRAEYRRFFELTCSVRLVFDRFSMPDVSHNRPFEDVLRAREDFDAALLGLSILGEKCVVEHAIEGHKIVTEMIAQFVQTMKSVNQEMEQPICGKELTKRIRADIRPHRKRYANFQSELANAMRRTEVDDDVKISADFGFE